VISASSIKHHILVLFFVTMWHCGGTCDLQLGIS